MKKRILIALGVLVLAAGIGAGGWYYYTHHAGAAGGSDIVYVTKISKLSEMDSGVENRYAGVVEPQETVQVKIESGRKVKEVQVKTGQEVKKGQLLFQYDLGSIQQSLQEAQLALDRLKNEQLSISDQITTLEAEKKKATADNQLSYTIEIETQKMNLKKNEYDQKSKQAEIDKYQKSIDNSEVTSKMAGVVKEINENGVDPNGNTAAYMKILATGEYRVKGTIDETSVGTISEGTPVILRSRLDETQTWTGSISKIDTESSQTDSNSSDMYDGGSSGDSASKYSFYVTLDSTDGLMLGQHLYIEPDYGQGEVEEKEGVWLYGYYIVQDDGDPYVWAADKKNRLEKRKVELGEYDENLDEYEIKSGLSEDDLIAFPMQGLYEGVTAVTNMEEVDYSSPLYNQESTDDSGMDEGMYDEAGTEFTDSGESGATDSEVVE